MSPATFPFHGPVAELPSISLSGQGGAPTALAVTRRSERRIVGALMVGLIALSPLPAGSNLPVAWLFWASLIGLISGVIMWRRPSYTQVWMRHRALFATGLGLAMFALFQSLWPGAAVGDAPARFWADQYLLTLSQSDSVFAAVRIASSVVFLSLCIWAFAGPGRARRAAEAIFVAITLYAIWGVAAIGTGGGSVETALVGQKPVPVTGPFTNHNAFATFLGFGFVTGLSLFTGCSTRKSEHRSLRPRIKQTLIGIGLCLIFAAILATQSRMGMTATLAGAAVPLAVLARSHRQWPLVILGAGIIMIALFGQGLTERFLFSSSSLSTRWQLYQQVQGLIAARPLTGFGAGSFPLAFELVHAPGVSSDVVWTRAHSTYLTLWSEYGLLIGSIPIIAGITVLRGIANRWRVGDADPALAMAAIGAIILAAVHSIFDFSLEIQANAFLLLAILGLALARSDGTTRRSRPSNSPSQQIIGHSHRRRTQ